MSIDDLAAMYNKIATQAYDMKDKEDKSADESTLKLVKSVTDVGLYAYKKLKDDSDSMELFTKVNSVRNVLTDQLTKGNPDLLDPKVYNSYADQIVNSMNELSDKHKGLFESSFRDSVTKNSILLVNTLNEARNKQEKQRGIVNAHKFLSASDHRYSDYENVLSDKDGKLAKDLLIDAIGVVNTENYINHQRIKSAMLSLHDHNASNADISAYLLNVVGMPQDEINKHIASANREKENAYLITTTRLSEIQSSNPIGFDVGSRIVGVMRLHKHAGIHKATESVIVSINLNPNNSENEKTAKINAAKSFEQIGSAQIAKNNQDFLIDVGFGTSAGFTHPSPDHKGASALEFALAASDYDKDGRIMLFNSDTLNKIKKGDPKVIPFLKQVKTAISTYTGEHRKDFEDSFDKVMESASPIILGGIVTGDSEETLKSIEKNAIDAKGMSITDRLDQAVQFQIDNHFRNSGDSSSPTKHIIGTLFNNDSTRSLNLYQTDPIYKNLILYQFSKNYKNGEPTDSALVYDLERQAGIKQLQIHHHTIWTTIPDLTTDKIFGELMDKFNNLSVPIQDYIPKHTSISEVIPGFHQDHFDDLARRYKEETIWNYKGINTTMNKAAVSIPDLIPNLSPDNYYDIKQVGANNNQLYSNLFDRPVLHPVTRKKIVISYGN